MKKLLLVRLAILLLTILTLSGCIWWPRDDGHGSGDHHEGDRGDHRGEDHGDHHGEDNGYHH
jgi:hypothetical protein